RRFSNPPGPKSRKKRPSRNGTPGRTPGRLASQGGAEKRNGRGLGAPAIFGFTFREAFVASEHAYSQVIEAFEVALVAGNVTHIVGAEVFGTTVLLALLPPPLFLTKLASLYSIPPFSRVASPALPLLLTLFLSRFAVALVSAPLNVKPSAPLVAALFSVSELEAPAIRKPAPVFPLP